MVRLAWSQVRFRLARTLALVAGVLVAATGFTVLTAASQTAQVRTLGTVSANFRAAYDILVRPKGARTAVESRTGTVERDFLSGIYGGISMAQYRKIQRISGVQVAAPVAATRSSMPPCSCRWPRARWPGPAVSSSGSRPPTSTATAPAASRSRRDICT